MKKKRKEQCEFAGVNGWGGKRTGSGRPNLSGRVNHMKRPELSIKTPLHITLRLREKQPSIRNKNLYKEFKESVRRAKLQGLYIIHYSVQSNHIHLFCEGRSKRDVALGMRALAGRFAKYIRAYAAAKTSCDARGSVFKGRYHLHILKTPREVKNALEYVLLNLSKHQKVIEYLDEFSSGRIFKHWRKLLGHRFKSLIKLDIDFWDQQSPIEIDSLSLPRSWLAQTGWMKACS